MGKGRSKRPPNPPAAPAVKQTPRNLPPELPAAFNSEDRLCWRFTHVDNEGPWGFGDLTAEAICDLLAQLVAFESMTVHEAFHKGDYPGKSYELEGLPNPVALERLEAINLADQTKIWRLRVGGTGRLYGFLKFNVFHVVWWDPDHQVWPSQKRNT
jgi:hypothetical protein